MIDEISAVPSWGMNSGRTEFLFLNFFEKYSKFNLNIIFFWLNEQNQL